MAKKPTKLPNSNPYKPNFWGMIQGITIATINKGQFLLFCLFLIIVILIIKAPGASVGELLHNFAGLLREEAILGWIFAFLELMVNIFVIRFQRKTHHDEIERISREKSKLQEELIGRKLHSSKGNKIE